MQTLRKDCKIRVIQTDLKPTSPCPKFIVLPPFKNRITTYVRTSRRITEKVFDTYQEKLVKIAQILFPGRNSNQGHPEQNLEGFCMAFYNYYLHIIIIIIIIIQLIWSWATRGPVPVSQSRILFNGPLWFLLHIIIILVIMVVIIIIIIIFIIILCLTKRVSVTTAQELVLSVPSGMTSSLFADFFIIKC